MLPSVPLRSATRWLGLAVAVVALALPAAAQRTVTLRMNSATVADTIKASQALAGAQVRGQLGSGTALPGGGVIDWNANTTVLPQNVGGDYWQVQFQIPDNDPLNFKFYFDQLQQLNISGYDGWETGDNYNIPAGTGPVTLDLHYFNKTGGNQPYDWRPFVAQGDSIAVWFRVFMRTRTAVNNGYTRDDPALRVSLRGNFGVPTAQSPNSTGGVGAGGQITDWSSTPGAPEARLTRESGDQTRPGFDLYSGLVKYPASSAGLTQTYKFFFEDTDTNTDGRSYESGISDRTFRIPAAGRDTTLYYQNFSNSPAASAAPLVSSDITFAVDVRPLSDAGIFQVADDLLQVRGGFNSFQCPAPPANQDNCALTRVPNSFIYTRQIPLTAQANSPQTYKYFVAFTPAEPTDVGFEEPLDYGGGDRTFTFQGASGGQAIGTEFFNGIRPGNVIPAGRTIPVTWTVDMRPALGFAPRAFNPLTDDVTISFDDPLWVKTQGRQPVGGGAANIVPGFKLTDLDGDGIYTGTLNVTGPTYNGIGYKVAFGNVTDSYYVEGSGGFNPGRRRYRYITNVNATSFSFGRDRIRSNAAGNPLPWEINPTGTFTVGQIPFSQANGFVDPVVANEGGPGRAGALQISALFPNPTTGIARMTVRTAEGEALTVRVYDVMGRLVTTAAENVRSAGEQTVQIDTQGLAAGLYVVRAESGTAVATRRLTVIR